MASHLMSAFKSKPAIAGPFLEKDATFVLVYLFIVVLPFIATCALHRQDKTACAAILSLAAAKSIGFASAGERMNFFCLFELHINGNWKPI